MLLKTRTYLAAWRSLQVSFLAPCAHSYGKMICSNELRTHTHIIIIITDIVHSKDSLVSCIPLKASADAPLGVKREGILFLARMCINIKSADRLTKGWKKKQRRDLLLLHGDDGKLLALDDIYPPYILSIKMGKEGRKTFVSRTIPPGWKSRGTWTGDISSREGTFMADWRSFLSRSDPENAQRCDQSVTPGNHLYTGLDSGSN